MRARDQKRQRVRIASCKATATTVECCMPFDISRNNIRKHTEPGSHTYNQKRIRRVAVVQKQFSQHKICVELARCQFFGSFCGEEEAF